MSKSVSELILNHLSDYRVEQCLHSLIYAIKIGLESLGIKIDRIQLPFTKLGGFRHPTYWAIILTWNDINHFEDSFIVPHEDKSNDAIEGNFSLENIIQNEELAERLGSFYELIKSQKQFYQQKLDQPNLAYPMHKKLKEQGYVDYCAFTLALPYSPVPQFMSISSRQAFPENIEKLILPHISTLSMAVYGAYRTNQAYKLAECYIGPRTGARVMNGEIARNHSSIREIGIMFCDIRNFTKLSEELGSSKIVPIMNDIFELIAQAASAHGGEILKFIGDAVLLIFDHDKVSAEQTSKSIVATVEDSLRLLDEYAQKNSLPVTAGFGCHIGQVTYGNIGSKTRLDFTVMGPNVNLTSRLESLTKSLDTHALFSESIAKYVSKLTPCGEHKLKGISKPVKAWKL